MSRVDPSSLAAHGTLELLGKFQDSFGGRSYTARPGLSDGCLRVQ